MAKRHSSLAPLSRDHHHGLALALRLRQGPKALLVDGWTHDPVRQARRVLRFAEEELAPHFAAEEEALFPFLRMRAPELVPLLERLIGEHRLLETLLAQLASADGPPMPGLLEQIGEYLERHIRAEERELFPACESLGAALEEIGHPIVSVRDRESKRRHRALYAEARVVIDAPTEAIVAALLDVDRYGSWWPNTVVFIPTGAVRGVEGAAVDVTVHERSIGFTISEIQQGRFIEFTTIPGASQGTMRWEVSDARGGRLVRWELNIDWDGERLMDAHLDLAQAAHEALGTLSARVTRASSTGNSSPEQSPSTSD
jgi:iron-sulfur cluster repair protein YtfE (RIC family)